MGIFREGFPGSNLHQNESIPVIKAQESIKKIYPKSMEATKSKIPPKFYNLTTVIVHLKRFNVKYVYLSDAKKGYMLTYLLSRFK